MNKADQTIYDSSRKRRVLIFQRADGHFSSLEEYFSDDPHEQCWIPLSYGRSLPICDTLESVLREACGRARRSLQRV